MNLFTFFFFFFFDATGKRVYCRLRKRVTLISWEAEHPEQQIGQAFYMQKNHTISILHTGYKVIGYTFAKQSYWYKLRGLHVYKAILLAQTSRAFVQT